MKGLRMAETRGQPQAPDAQAVERLVGSHRAEDEAEAQRHAIDLRRAELSAEWQAANERGDATRCAEIESLNLDLLRLRRQI